MHGLLTLAANGYVLAMGGLFSDKLQTKKYTSTLRKFYFKDETPPIANTMLGTGFF